MYDKLEKQYILRHSAGIVQNIYYKESTGICVRSLSKKNIWRSPEVIVKTSYPHFSTCLDSSDNIHILSQDENGNIIYLSNSKGTWIKRAVLNTRKLGNYDKHLHILSAGEKIFFFYVIEYPGKRLLYYQALQAYGSLSNPKVISHAEDTGHPYFISLDKSNNIYVFFKADHQIGYRKYDTLKNYWAEFVPIMENAIHYELLSAVLDCEDNIHLCWQRPINSRYELLYGCKFAGSEDPSVKRSVYLSSVNDYSTSIVIINDTLNIYWVRDNQILYSSSKDKGYTWSEPEVYDFYGQGSLYSISLKTNVPNQLKNIFFNELPCYINESYNIAFVDDMQGTPNCYEALSLNDSSLEVLLQTIESQLQSLNSKEKSIELEIEKLGIKSSLVDTELSKLKSDVDLLKKAWKASVREEPKSIPANQAPPPQKLPSSDTKPILPGTGFAAITPEFLRNLKSID